MVANFCPSCSAALEPGSKFCADCGATVKVTVALASEVRDEIKAGVRSFAAAPGMQVPPPIWAGVIEIFWIFVTVAGSLPSLVVAGVALGASVVPGVMGGGSDPQAERFAIWAVISALFAVVQLCFQVPLAIGLFSLKEWAYGLYMWTFGPFILIGIILHFGRPTIEELERKIPLSVSMVTTTSSLFFLALIGLQVFLVRRSKELLVN